MVYLQFLVKENSMFDSHIKTTFNIEHIEYIKNI